MAVENAMLLENPNGTAFGEIIEFNGKIIILIPGPLNEWLSMWDKIKDFLSKKLNSKKRIYSVRFKIADLKESELEKALKPITKKDFTILSGPNICEFILRGYDKRKIEKLKIKVEKIIGPNIYGYEEDTIEKKLGELLKQKGKTLSIAESCTGGLVSSRITDIPGSSAYYLGGINAYSNEIKTKMIKVNKKTIKKYGAVSEQTAYEMALKSRKIFDSDYSVSVTGIAGPEGGTEDKPVGLVWFGISGKEKTLTEKRIFLKKDRSYIKEAAANTAMFLLYKMIK
jgi:nicotinamide-nucleotide amidase